MPIDIEKWASLSDRQTLKMMRNSLKLDQLGEKTCKCLRCHEDFVAQTIGGRRNQFFCYDCKEWIGRQADCLI